MRPRSHYGNSFSLPIHFGLASACVVVFTATLFASSAPGSVVARDNLSPAHRADLTTKLRTITGWQELSFNDEGFLQVSGEKSQSGSRAARELIESAIEGKQIIVIEDASSRSDVAFCRVVPGRWIGAVSRPEPVYVVLVDFTDFGRVMGDDEARAAFNVGWGFLHEIDHIVNDSQDPQGASESAGDCEDHINQMRSEIGLPVRADYFFSPLPTSTDPNFMTRLVRLSFVEKKNGSAKGKRYWLVWDAALVGGWTEQWKTALVRSAH
jgi:hypothetical protein